MLLKEHILLWETGKKLFVWIIAKANGRFIHPKEVMNQMDDNSGNRVSSIDIYRAIRDGLNKIEKKVSVL